MIRVRRVLIVEGPESWVNQTLANSLVNPEREYLCIGSIREDGRETVICAGTIHEVERETETSPTPSPSDPPTLQNTGHDDPPTLR